MNLEENKAKFIDPDFPFYNENPKIEPWGLLLLAAAVIYLTISIFTEIQYPGYLGPIAFCGIPLIAYLIVARGKLSLIVRKFKANDFVRIIVTLVLQYVFVLSIGVVRTLFLGSTPTANAVMDSEMNLSFWLQVFVQLFGEELYKLLIFLVSLTIIYKFSKNRTLSVVASTAITLLCFALAHATAYDYQWVQILLNQGLATFFCMYNYLKSKNILTSYLQHVLLDAIPFILAMAGVFDKLNPH